ncbi:MAG: signal peptide peptidase SppA [Candidatus Latescibacteria bacterium]|nr:signal peptide peptidase SppA [Candidatus Latescibacterota bacterium]NIM22423.1 signal peptide peptidase SppA [Candidatus Latescibacterota bacterium]NIM64783.1 signal peptide peptidase SppA [Candidatus Latescibacterota bacterium]NIO01294.1 signal peptide peptidase SppA [Candidatus Latescibacterota bacterium]NIO27786.1 signal peptide peptidase SppA [Candidatus Latescibacterota bacterium]
MNRSLWLGLLVTVLIICGAGYQNPASADDLIPSYYSHLDFNLTSPGARATSVGAFANPAVYRMLPDGEIQFYWSDEAATLRSIPKWGLFLGAPHLGFGTIHTRFTHPLTGGPASVTDYRLALALGNKSSSVGLGFGWSGGDEDLAGRSRIIQTGAIRRFGRYASLGLVGAFSTQTDARSGLVDVAVRPLGDLHVTVFADAEFQNGIRFEDSPWSVGAMVEPLPGLQITGRYFEDESYAISVGFSFGRLSASASPRIDKNGDLDRTLYGIRIGYREPNIYNAYLAKDRSYLHLQLTGSVKHRKYRFFDEETHTLSSILAALDAAREDPRVKGVALNLSGAMISKGKAWEIRDKLKELKKEGKRVVVYVDEVGMTHYHIASVADKIVMDPLGTMILPGYVMGRTFLVNLLEKLGLGVDEWRFFKYKSAFEVLSRDKMSEPEREQRLALIEGYYDEIKKSAMAERGVSAQEFDRWINEEGIFLADKALSEGLVDEIGRWEDVKDVVEELEGSKKRYISPSKLERFAIPSTLWGENSQIALVYGLGVCAMDEGIRARSLGKIFDRVKKDRRVKAVVFRVDSPGGDALASDIVAEALRKCAEKKPVIVSQGDVAGSGGYWISMYGTEILALPTTITGSIGVIGGWVWNDGIGEKLGLTSDHVKVGKHADLGFGIVVPLLGVGIPDRNLTEEERDKAKRLLLDLYDDFLDKVAKGRKMDREQVHEIGQGRVWTGAAGKANGLVDRIGGLDLAVRLAKEAAGIKPDDIVDVVEYPKAPLINLSFLKPRRLLPFGGSSSEKELLPGNPDEDYADNYEWLYLQALARSKGRPLYMVPPELLPREAGLMRK